MTGGPTTIRLDKWLWYGRFFKTRGLSARAIAAGHVRLNGARIAKPAQRVGVGDVLTFAQARRVRVVRILALGSRRGPAAEARALYDDLSPPAPDGGKGRASAARAGPRPTKRDRRAIDGLKS